MNKKIIKIILVIFISTISINATNTYTFSSSQKGKMQTPLTNLIKTTQWDLFMTEFSIKLKIDSCGEGMDKAWGFKARMIEPIGYFETTKKRLNFPFAGFQISESAKKTSTDDFANGAAEVGSDIANALGEILSFGSPRKPQDEDENAGGRDNMVWSHFIYVPIFGLLFKKKLKFLCLSGGDIALPMLSEFLPPYTKDILFKNMIAQMAIMFSPQGLISSIMNCAATMGVNAMHSFVSGESGALSGAGMTQFLDEQEAMDPNNQNQDSTSPSDTPGIMEKTEYFLDSIRNTMYWNVGCLGFAPVGGYIHGDDPGTDHELILYEHINLLHGASSVLPKPFLHKQTNFSIAGVPKTGDGRSVSALDSMCEPKRYPIGIESQYIIQRAGIPTIGRAHCLGVSPVVSTTAANVPDSGDDWVSVVWQARDYYAFAYLCPMTKNK